jgi:uncharacterized membrane protein
MILHRAVSEESRLEAIISYILITGVIISLCLEVTGIVLFYLSYRNFVILLEDRSAFIQAGSFFNFLYVIFQRDGFENKAFLFMTLGLAALILTPYIRVIASFIYFAWKRNFKYIIITAFVLLVLTLSLATH